MTLFCIYKFSKHSSPVGVLRAFIPQAYYYKWQLFTHHLSLNFGHQSLKSKSKYSFLLSCFQNIILWLPRLSIVVFPLTFKKTYGHIKSIWGRHRLLSGIIISHKWPVLKKRFPSKWTFNIYTSWILGLIILFISARRCSFFSSDVGHPALQSKRN